MKRFSFTSSLFFIVLAFVLAPSCKDDENNNDQPTDSDTVVVSGEITTDQTWQAENVYELAGKVVVQEGVELTIEAGTIVKGREGAGSLASALIISRGAKIYAVGTQTSPIIFTSILDNIEPGEITGTNLNEDDREKWGGLIILGKAPISAKEGDTEAQIEGIPANETFGTYGGSEPTDNSGTLSFVSIRHGGALIGEGNEINGLTLGGVGSGTTISNVEVVANLDDGIECFGGTVNISNALVAFQGDDAFDIDQNYSGTLSNIIAIQGADSDNALEIDGPENATYSNGLFSIVDGTFSTTGDGRAASLKSRAQGTIDNCFFNGFSKWIRVRASYDDQGVPKIDAFDHYVDDLSLTPLVLTDNEFNATSGADLIDVYVDDEDEAQYVPTQSMEDNADTQFSDDNNTTATSPSGGASSNVFETWTWSSANGKI